MVENIIITAGTEPKGAENDSHCDAKVVILDLDVLDEKIHFRIGVGQGRARLADIVPLARTISTKITEVVLKNIYSKGYQIPCYKGCSACCNRCLVPLSVPEAFRLNEDIKKAPVLKRESIWRDCLNASRHILLHKPPKKIVHRSTEDSSNKPADINLISSWYTSFNLACPFLQQDVCTIYEQRPLACREHYIIGSAEGCSEEHSSAEVLEMPIQMPNALSQLASELEGTGEEALILPLALVWCKQNKKRAARTWPYEMMVKRFVEIIEVMASTNYDVVAV